MAIPYYLHSYSHSKDLQYQNMGNILPMMNLTSQPGKRPDQYRQQQQQVMQTSSLSTTSPL